MAKCIMKLQNRVIAFLSIALVLVCGADYGNCEKKASNKINERNKDDSSLSMENQGDNDYEEIGSKDNNLKNWESGTIEEVWIEDEERENWMDGTTLEDWIALDEMVNDWECSRKESEKKQETKVEEKEKSELELDLDELEDSPEEIQALYSGQRSWF